MSTPYIIVTLHGDALHRLNATQQQDLEQLATTKLKAVRKPQQPPAVFQPFTYEGLHVRAQYAGGRSDAGGHQEWYKVHVDEPER